jgi:SAM-dependent methyltransferase
LENQADRFCRAFPGHQAALDIYKGAWTTAMPPGSGLRAGDNDLFSDVRVAWAAARLGGLADKSILELGPYEGYNTHQFETLGAASVVSIENNRDNFLKCLIVKNIVGLRAVFLHGDMMRFLQDTEIRYDLCWASGLLYHMTDPIGLLRGIGRVSKTLFIWTHYVHPARSNDPDVTPFFDARRDQVIEVTGRQITLHHRNYNADVGSYYSGGSHSYSYWMKQADIFHVLSSLGFSNIEMGIDNPKHPSGGACFFLARAN